jgi:aspartyl-tRNA(Asn)/glutamyl-tRNA(Gln) amidotransferase subunit B
LNEVGPRREGRPPLSARQLASLLRLLAAGSLNRDQARRVLEVAWDTGTDPAEVATSQGLAQVSDEEAIEGWAREVIAANPRAAADFQAGKQQAIGPLVGQLVGRSGGKANARLAADVLRRLLTR